MQMKTCLEPIIGPQSRILILGTLPGDESLRLAQYYAGPDNHFWEILEAVYDETAGPSYKARIDFLKRKGLALWDVLHRAARSGSVDGNIRNGVVNDFETFFAEYTSLKTVVFNGSKAEKLFRSLVCGKERGETANSLRFVRVASSSSTPGRYVPPFEDKVTEWKAALNLISPAGASKAGRSA
jgi:hypoxanthine-DNA glycosylase